MAVSSQLITVNSTIPAGAITCPGEEVNITCETRGSAVLIWTSSDYVGGQLEFNAGNSLEEIRRGSVDPNTIATFLTNILEGGTTRVLVSQLRIIVSSISLTPSVTCIHGRDNTPVTFTFQVLGSNLIVII